MNLILIGSFLIGLTSNIHCLGMCGPIASSLPLNRKNNWSILSGLFEYNFGRILVYSILGVIIGAIGFTVSTFNLLQTLSILSGVFLIIYAWNKRYHFIQIKNPMQSRWTKTLQKMLGKTFRTKSSFKLVLLGGINGLLPCGMVFIALMNASITGDIWFSAIAMFVFGLGTTPAMFGVAFFMHKINWKASKKLTVLVPYLLTIIGLMIILRGLNLGIPYLSPQVKTIQQNSTNSNTPSTIDFIDCH